MAVHPRLLRHRPLVTVAVHPRPHRPLVTVAAGLALRRVSRAALARMVNPGSQVALARMVNPGSQVALARTVLRVRRRVSRADRSQMSFDLRI